MPKSSSKPNATNQSYDTNSITSGTVVNKINMLRGFVSNDTFSETDLSNCLRQANYNVELAAERLIMGQFHPTKKQKMLSPPTTTTRLSSNPSKTPTATRKSNTVTPNLPLSCSEGRLEGSPNFGTNVASPPLRPSPPLKVLAPLARTAVGGGAAPSRQPQLAAPIDDSSWLLCHRWISDGVCLQRNGCVDYQEELLVEVLSSSNSSTPTSNENKTTPSNSNKKTSKVPSVRFRGSRIIGHFPRHLHTILGPLLHANLIQVRAQALMEDRFLPTGVDVAFAVWIYLPDPVKFFELLHPYNLDSSLNSAKAFFGKQGKGHPTAGQTMLQQAAFGLLQWAQNGETFDFSSSEEKDGSGEDDVDMVVVEDREDDYDPTDEEEAVSKTDGLVTRPTILQGMDTPDDFRATLRPYQRQALWWMTQREAQQELEDSSKQQLELLEELVQSTPLPCHRSSSPIHCECGPVQVDTSQTQAPAVVSDDERSPDMKHPLWERRFLTNPSKTKALSFYVQPLFGAAMASPPEPPRACRGGILADSMGLGKSVMLLALIQTSLKNEASQGSTLIVSPLSLLLQWQEEIESKTNLTYRTYYGDNRQGEDFNVDVVLTTYGSLQSEWLTFSKAPEGSGSSVLLGHEWKRVILDEAHYVKNTSTVASKACRMLRAERRWCVSGTIIQNSLDDVYALLAFLRHEPWCHKSFWKAAISTKLRSAESTPDDKQEGLDRVRRLLAPIMLRRTKTSLDQDGQPILTLPPVETKDIAIQFSPPEREFYDALHRKSLSLFEGFIQAGTASKSWLAIFSLLHRLRQTCDHVALTVKSHLDDEEWASQIAQGPDVPKKEATNTKDSIDKKFLDDLMGKFRSMQSTGKKGHVSEDAPYAAKIALMLNEAVERKASMLKEECSICLDPINIHESVVTPCFHIFCKDCLVGVLRQPKAAQPSEASKTSAVLRLPNGLCPVCNEEVDSSKILRLSQSGGQIHTSSLLTSMVQPTLVANREGDGAARQTLETAVRGSSSSKLTAILQELEAVWDEQPGSKVLIFSQFLGFLDLMEEAFKKNLIPFARLDGKLSLKDRVRVLKEFGADTDGEHQRIPGGTKVNAGSVLLISMKAGGVGLNLVAANTVFIADRWWNAAVEDQCIDRIHRIGQTAEKVRVRKFYVSNTVEERIVELQKRKKNVASEVLCDAEQADADGHVGSLPTLEDFKILFQE